MADSSLVEDALLTKLLSDGPLRAILADGWWWDLGGEGKKRLGIVSLVDHSDVPVFGGRAWEDYLFLVKAVVLTSTGADIKAAAARIDALLEDGQLTVPGYGLMDMFRVRRIRYTERDDNDAAIRWLHRGGQYRVRVALV